MIPPITKLIIKIEQLEWDLAAVKEELVKLQAGELKSMSSEDRAAARSEKVKAQRKRLNPTVENALGKLDPDIETFTAEELQQMLLEEGIKPKDNIGSRAIIEERERRR